MDPLISPKADPRLARNDHRLVGAIVHHVVVRLVADGEDVGILASNALYVRFHDLGSVEGEHFERVDRNEDGTHGSVDHIKLEPDSKVVEDRIFIQVVEGDEIVHLG